MNSKKITIIAVFAALAIVLNMSPLKFPAPYAPFLFYQVWEIPIVTAFILYGFVIGSLISVANTIVLLIAFPGALPTGPLYNLIAVLSTLLGILLATKLLLNYSSTRHDSTSAIILTAAGTIIRVIVMSIVNWICLPFPPPLGFSMPREAVTPMIPIIGFFNATLALYTIPISYILASAVRSRINISNNI